MSEPAAFLAAMVALIEKRSGAGEDLDRLAAAREVATEIGDLPDRLLGLFIDQARTGGATWGQIGDVLGVSRQAAQQRTVPASFQRYTKRATRAVERAQTLAREHGQAAVSPGLLLAASCQDRDARATGILLALDVTSDDLEQAVLAALPPAIDSVPDRPGFTIAARQTLDQAVREARRRGHRQVGTEHLLLAALRQSEGLPNAVIDTFSLSYEEAAARIRPQ